MKIAKAWQLCIDWQYATTQPMRDSIEEKIAEILEKDTEQCAPYLTQEQAIAKLRKFRKIWREDVDSRAFFEERAEFIFATYPELRRPGSRSAAMPYLPSTADTMAKRLLRCYEAYALSDVLAGLSVGREEKPVELHFPELLDPRWLEEICPTWEECIDLDGAKRWARSPGYPGEYFRVFVRRFG